ncbi:hypothetical protein FRIG_03660 [Frigoribacterium faeni]|uniref:hypothetical protein n=1 Tax=Frigoribacterium faeni TaxID=145483 RepID=UPI001FAE6411|nr:hypothetical protein [Frigoribacterium faeni]MCJ0700237.1 hypothetical protein [Frigoribacterium faeni]
MDLWYTDEAADKLDFYDENDSTLGDAFDAVLQVLKKSPNDSRLKQRYLRPPDAYVVPVQVPGRDTRYYVFWQYDENGDIWIKYAGSSAAAI